MSQFLSATTLARVDELHRQFSTAKPFRHVVIDDFLDDAVCRRMTDEFPAFDEAAATNELGLVGGKAVQEGIRELGGVYAEVDRQIQEQRFLRSIGQISGIDDLLYDPHYTGGGTHENISGQSLDPHVDFNYHPIEHWHRRLNLIVYLNEEWDEAWGGAIEFHRDPWADDDEIATWLPSYNRAVLFETTERSWHGFRQIRPSDDGTTRSRRSFAVYLYSHDRPEDETFAPHTTHYVQRPLPEHLVAGHTLDASDVTAISKAVGQRTHWIRFMYDREMELSAEIERLRGELSSRRPAVLPGASTLRRWFRRSPRLQALAPKGSRRRRTLRRAAGHH